MKIWTVANQKGGVGKTTTSVTLGGSLAALGSKTLLVDLDPHGSLTSYFGYNPDTMEESVYSLFDRKISGSRIPFAAMLRKTGEQNLDLLPASTAMVSLERRLSSLNGMGLVLRDALQGYHSHYQYVIIDCSPSLGVLMINALAACDLLLIPVQTEFLAIKGLDRMLNTLNMVKLSGNHINEYIIIPTMFDKRTRASRSSLKLLNANYRDKIWSGYIPVDTNFREASRIGKPPSSIAPDARGVIAYQSLLSEMLISSLDRNTSEQRIDFKEAV